MLPVKGTIYQGATFNPQIDILAVPEMHLESFVGFCEDGLDTLRHVAIHIDANAYRGPQVSRHWNHFRLCDRLFSRVPSLCILCICLPGSESSEKGQGDLFRKHQEFKMGEGCPGDGLNGIGSVLGIAGAGFTCQEG